MYYSCLFSSLFFFLFSFFFFLFSFFLRLVMRFFFLFIFKDVKRYSYYLQLISILKLICYI